MECKKQSMFWYRITQFASYIVSKFIFKRKFVRNEIKGKKGPFVIIANHEAAYDFVNLIGATNEPMTFVISNSFYNALPFKKPMDKIGVIPKQQFQTTLHDIKAMRCAIDNGRILVIYPAGLMCEDGLSTPIPEATYKFLKWIKADIYGAKTEGTYFAMPKWSKGLRKGKTYLDIYKLFDKEEIENMDEAEIKKKADEVLLFDAYRDQEERRIKYRKNSNIEGLENVLYVCPHCKREFTMNTKKNKIYCSACGYEQEADKYAFFHKTSKVGKEIRYVSDWSRLIYKETRKKIENGVLRAVNTTVEITKLVNGKFVEIGKGILNITKSTLSLKNENELDLNVSTVTFPSLPFKPGVYLEIQDGDNIYRCKPNDPRHVIKLVGALKIFHEISMSETAKETAHA